MKERIQFNLAERWKQRFSRSQRQNRKRNRSIMITTAICILVLMGMALPWIWEYRLNYEQALIQQEILKYHEVSATLAEADRLNAEISEIQRFFLLVEESAKNPRFLMGEITKLLPVGSKVTSFALQSDYSLQLAVIVPGPVDTARLWISFRDSGLFTEVDLNSVPLTDQEHNLSLDLKFKL